MRWTAYGHGHTLIRSSEPVGTAIASVPIVCFIGQLECDGGSVAAALADHGRPDVKVQRFDFFGSLPDVVRQAFLQAARSRRYAAGQVLYHKGEQGHEMYRVVSGEIRLSYLRESGSELFHTLYRPNDCFGMSSLLDSCPRPQMAEARTDAVVQVLGRRAFNDLRQAYRAFDEALILLLIGDIRGLIDRVNTRVEVLPSRVARCVLKYARPQDGGAMSANLSQSELATRVGASRQSVNKVLGQFQAAGLIRLQYGRIAIDDLPSLAERIEAL